MQVHQFHSSICGDNTVEMFVLVLSLVVLSSASPVPLPGQSPSNSIDHDFHRQLSRESDSSGGATKGGSAMDMIKMDQTEAELQGLRDGQVATESEGPDRSASAEDPDADQGLDDSLPGSAEGGTADSTNGNQGQLQGINDLRGAAGAEGLDESAANSDTDFMDTDADEGDRDLMGEICMVEKAGSFALSECSGQFVKCVEGRAEAFACPDGLVFDGKNCAYPIDVKGCMSDEVRPTVESTTPISFVDDSTVIECQLGADMTDNGRLREEFARALHITSDHVREIRLIGLRKLHVKCAPIPASEVDAVLNGKRQPMINHNNQFVPIVTIRVIRLVDFGKSADENVFPFVCDGKSDGNYEAGKCSWYFWSCVANQTSVRVCARGLRYDQKFDRCDTPDQLPGCDGRRIAEPTTSEVPPTTTEALCSNTDVAECDELYFSCANGKPDLRVCLGGRVYDRETGQCVARGSNCPLPKDRVVDTNALRKDAPVELFLPTYRLRFYGP